MTASTREKQITSNGQSKVSDTFSNVQPEIQVPDNNAYINPFVHRLQELDTISKAKTYILTLILLPLRVLCIIFFLLTSYLLACIAIYGMSLEEIQRKPLSGWRKNIRLLVAVTMRMVFVCGSFNYIKFKGKQASFKDAPVLVVGPHSSFFDAIVVIILGPPAVVAKAETGSLPIFGKLINFSQPIYVWRDDPNSRQTTIKSIIERANSKMDWNQVIIFPEGTCTNRSALITFKSGAFYPGVPIQPVCIRYPNKLDTFTWTWEGPSAWRLLWLTLTQFHSACEIEFLPVYTPSEEEKANPKLYAKNVRDVMAKSLNLPVSDYSYDDCKIMSKAKDWNLPSAADIVEIEKVTNLLFPDRRIYNEDVFMSLLSKRTKKMVNLTDFAEFLNIPTNDNLTRRLFNIFDQNCIKFVNLDEYLLSVVFLIKQDSTLFDFMSMGSTVNPIFGQIHTSSTLLRIFNRRISRQKCEMIITVLKESRGRTIITIDDLKMFLEQNPKYNSYIRDSKKVN